MCMSARGLMSLTNPKDLDDLKDYCKADARLAVQVGASVFISLCVLLLCVYTLLKKRYYILLLYRRLTLSRSSQGDDYEYDCFVAYVAEDLDWVFDYLMKQLKGKYKLRLCIHSRDFMPGNAIMCEMETRMLKSRLVILVLSEHSLRSGHWITESLLVFNTHPLSVVLIQLGSVEPQLIHENASHLKLYLQAHNYLMAYAQHADCVGRKETGSF